MLTACVDNGLISLGKKIHEYIIKKKYAEGIALKTNLLNMYGKCGHLEEAVKIFNRIKVSERDIAIWNSMMSAYLEYGKDKEALMLYEEMKKERIKPDSQTVTCILKAYCMSNLMEDAIEMLFSMEKELGVIANEYHYNCLLTACTDKKTTFIRKKGSQLYR